MYPDPLSREAVEQNLREAGCPEGFIRAFLERYAVSTPGEQIRMLEEQRGELLARLHESQQHLDCMDYLCYQIRRRASGA